MKKIKAQGYDKAYSDKNNYVYEMRPQLFEVLKQFEFNSLLEVGCGNGRNLKYIQNNFDVSVLKGIDLSVAGVDVAKKNGIDAVVGSADRLPFSNAMYDVVLTYHSLEQMKYIIEDVIKEIYRVSKKYVICFEPCFELQNIFGKYHNFRMDYVKGLPFLFEKHGFEVKKFENLKIGRFCNSTCLLVLLKGKKDECSNCCSPS
jgi:ubiquinone/menaquinone biosynthesis C-methylase UbiE